MPINVSEEAEKMAFEVLDEVMEKYKAILMPNKGSKFYHYTTLEGLLGIIRERGIWLSDAAYLNDSHEIMDGQKYIRERISQYLSNETDHNIRFLLKSCEGHFCDVSTVRFYIASFSRSPNLLEQWRAYSNNGSGVCIEVDFNRSDSLSPFNKPESCYFINCVYKQEIKEAIIDDIVKNYCKRYASKKITRADEDCISYVLSLLSLLNFISIVCKDNVYSSENESRLVVFGNRCLDFGGLNYRVRNNRIVPYCCTGRDTKLKDNNILLPISEIMIGPVQKNNLILQAGIKDLLTNYRYDNVKVATSGIPYRG